VSIITPWGITFHEREFLESGLGTLRPTLSFVAIQLQLLLTHVEPFGTLAASV